MRQEQRILLWLREQYGYGNENVRIIRDAIKKQIPKKPEEHNMFYYCPTCGEAVVITDFETDITMDFCIKCGQAIDWEEESE